VTVVPALRVPVTVTAEPGDTPTIFPAVPVMVVAPVLVTVVWAKTPKLEEVPRSIFVAAEEIDGRIMTLIPIKTATARAERLKI
jgi:hypothetical protein